MQYSTIKNHINVQIFLNELFYFNQPWGKEASKIRARIGHLPRFQALLPTYSGAALSFTPMSPDQLIKYRCNLRGFSVF